MLKNIFFAIFLLKYLHGSKTLPTFALAFGDGGPPSGARKSGGRKESKNGKKSCKFEIFFVTLQSFFAPPEQRGSRNRTLKDLQ